jgi:hypothetical protein
MRLQAYFKVAKLHFFKLHLVLNLIIENMIQCTPLNVITDIYIIRLMCQVPKSYQ